jgi:DNA replication protein DnaC
MVYRLCTRSQRVPRRLYGVLPGLLQDLSLACGDGRYGALLTSFAKVDVLVLDHWGLAKLTEKHRRDLLELYKRRSPLTQTDQLQ